VPAGPDPRASLLAIWKGQQDEIVTGRFRIKIYRYGPIVKSSVTRDQLAKTLEQLNLANRPEDWAQVRKLFPPPQPDFTEFWGTTIEVLEEGTKGRNNWNYNLQSHAVAEAHVFNNQEDIEYNAFDKQALIMPGRSSVQMIHSRDLRSLPAWDPQHGPDQFEIVSRSGGRVTLRRDHVSLVVDESNGFVYHARGTAGKGVTKETYQFGPRKYAGDVLLPSVKLEIQADETGKLQWLSGYQMLEAEINIALPEDTFVIGVPADTNVVDLRKDRNNPQSRVTDQAVANVVDYANAAILRAQPEGTGALSLRRIVWLTSGCVLGIGLIVVALRLLRKPRTAQ
jgi:hypothetical protein